MKAREGKTIPATSRWLIRSGHLVDPEVGLDGQRDILIENGRISSIAKRIKPTGKRFTEIDATGLIICPAFCDIHVHLRTPGQQRKENIKTGSAAAARGGITTMVTMPNSSPPIDNPGRVRSILRRYKSESIIETHIAAAISKGRKGIEPADWESMRSAGAVAFTDDGDWCGEDVMRKMLSFSAQNTHPILSHAEDRHLHKNGCIHRGKVSRALGVPGIPSESEIEAVRRDIKLCAETGGKLHIQHISTTGALRLIRTAKRKGLPVTCEVTPHHLLLTEDDVYSLGPMAKMNPPLRTEKDRKALVEGLTDGTIDAIATDHAPHTRAEKMRDIREAPFGVTGLETMFASIHTELIFAGVISTPDFIKLASHKPRQIMGLAPITLARGSRADIALIDPNREFCVSAADFASRGKNSPFIGRLFRGMVVGTFHKGIKIF